MWQTAQAPSAASWRPRSIVAADQVDGSGLAIGAIEGAKASETAAKVAAPATAAPSLLHQGRRFAGSRGGGFKSGVPLRPASTRSGVSGNSRKRTPVASKTALTIAAALGTEADSPAPIGGRCWRSISMTSIAGSSGKVSTG